MKVAAVSVFVFTSMLALSAGANAQTTTRAECTNAILNGSYGVLHDGVVSNGSYTVNADCRGSASLEKTPFGTANWEFVIVGDGNEVLQIATMPLRGAVLWALKKQFSR